MVEYEDRMLFWCQNYKFSHYSVVNYHIGIWWRHIAPWIMVNIGSGKDMLPDGTKPLLEPMLSSSGNHLRVITRWVAKLLLHTMCLKITLLKLLPHLPRTNELYSVVSPWQSMDLFNCPIPSHLTKSSSGISAAMLLYMCHNFRDYTFSNNVSALCYSCHWEGRGPPIPLGR